MGTSRLQVAAGQRARRIRLGFGEELQRLREDVGASQRALSRITGVSQSEISRIEAGSARPSIETCVLLGAGLGADVSMRLFPNTGSPIRDRHQAPIVEALIALLGQQWRPLPEVGVRHPVRGWIDVVLVHQVAAEVVASEIVSEIHRFEQLLRWTGAKSEALPSAALWPFGITGEPSISRMLVVRVTAANRTLVETFRSTIEAAYPGDPWQALAALGGDAPWPGSVLIWARDEGGRVAIEPAPLRRRARTA